MATIAEEQINKVLMSINRHAFFWYRFQNLKKNIVVLNNISELKELFNWDQTPILDDPDLFVYESPLDVHERNIRDAESIGCILKNINPRIAVEIGTSTGRTTALMAMNAPNSQIYTVNIPPEEIQTGEGGILTTVALERERIGSYYRERGIKNIHQILANTAKWEPNIGDIDFAFIDGCHDSDFVYNDTLKILRHAKHGSFIAWHDFNLNLAKKYDWIHAVCTGIEWLYQKKVISGPILHIRDSWIGIYRVS